MKKPQKRHGEASALMNAKPTTCSASAMTPTGVHCAVVIQNWCANSTRIETVGIVVMKGSFKPWLRHITF